MRVDVITLACMAAIFATSYSMNVAGGQKTALLNSLNTQYRGAIDALDQTYQLLRAIISNKDGTSADENSPASELSKDLLERRYLSWDAIFRIVSLLQNCIKFVTHKLIEQKSGDSLL